MVVTLLHLSADLLGGNSRMAFGRREQPLTTDRGWAGSAMLEAGPSQDKGSASGLWTVAPAHLTSKGREKDPINGHCFSGEQKPACKQRSTLTMHPLGLTTSRTRGNDFLRRKSGMLSIPYRALPGLKRKGNRDENKKEKD